MVAAAAERDPAALAVGTPGPVPAVAETGCAAPEPGPLARVYEMSAPISKLEQALVPRAGEQGSGPADKSLAQALTFPAGPNLSEEDRAEAERRFAIIEPILKAGKGRRTELVQSAAAEFGLGRSTIYGWFAAFEKRGLAGLVRRDRADKGTSRRLSNAALEYILGTALPRLGIYGENSAKEIFRQYEDERQWRAAHAGKQLNEEDQKNYRRYLVNDGSLNPSAQLPKISYETCRRWFNRIPEPFRSYAREGEDAFHATQLPISHRDLEAINPMDILVLDHRMLDVMAMVRWKRTWRLVRPWLTGALDMRSRRWLGWVIVEQPSSDSIVSVLKQVFVKFGIPRAVLTDHGKDFRCVWLEGREQKVRTASRVGEFNDGLRGVFETVGVRVCHAIPKRARSKIIEPCFIAVAHFDRSLPWWCGHRPSTRPERFAALVERHEAWLKGDIQQPPFKTIEEIARLYEDFFTDLNERPHEGEGMIKVTPTGRAWACPNEVWERLIGGVERRVVSPQLLQFCFMKRKTLTVRNGEIHATFDGRTLHYRVPGEPLRLLELNGKTVELAFDPLDVGIGKVGAVYYQGRFLGLVHAVEPRRMGEDGFVADERDRRAGTKAVKKLIEQIHSQVHVPDPSERLARRLPVLPQRSEPPRPEVAVTVPAALLEAAKAREEERRPVEPVEIAVISPPKVEAEEDGHFQFWSTEK